MLLSLLDDNVIAQLGDLRFHIAIFNNNFYFVSYLIIIQHYFLGEKILFTLIEFWLAWFIGIDYGGKINHTNENNITWVTDANYIDVSERVDTGNVTFPSYFQSL